MIRKMRGLNFTGITEMKPERFMISVFWITTVENAGEIEEYCALVYF